MHRVLRLLLDADDVWMLLGKQYSARARMGFYVTSRLGMRIQCLSVEEADTDAVADADRHLMVHLS